MDKLSLRDLKLNQKRVLMRVDFNVPLNADGSIRDATRIILTLPSIEYILRQKGRLVLISHLGRPKGSFDSKVSLRPCAQKLGELLGKEVGFCFDCIGAEVQKRVQNLNPGEVLLLENLRFHKGEESPEKDPGFAQSLAELGDVYINDAFGAAHRSHASIVPIAQFFPANCGVGFLMEKEIAAFSKIYLNPNRPFYAMVGGAKIGNKIDILQALSKRVDGLFIGGGMAFTFFKAKGLAIGESICDESRLKFARDFLKECERKGIRLHLPIDVVVTNGKKIQTVQIKGGVPDKWEGKDIGPQTVELWSKELNRGATLFWNGPMGVFEERAFASGTERLAHFLSEVPGDVTIGGGDLVAAVQSLNLEKKLSHVSSGGGASLEFLANGTLPGVEALSNK
uniref:Phosphoglycerate kinase n=1 Tax=Candidatus Fritschea bemisiae TaxID=206681 RepID=Q7X393_9BACT|nr:phosphoglycerate kinase [Candidatus Fritschea bemisiae]